MRTMPYLGIVLFPIIYLEEDEKEKTNDREERSNEGRKNLQGS